MAFAGDAGQQNPPDTEVFHACNLQRLQHEAARLDGAVPVACDIADEAQVAQLLELVARDRRDIDTVLLNAGVTHTYRLFDVFAALRVSSDAAVRAVDALTPSGHSRTTSTRKDAS